MAEESNEDSVPLENLTTDKTGALHPEDTLKTAGDRMRQHEAENWPVTEGRNLVGMLDQKDPDRIATQHGHDPNDYKVKEIMSKSLIYCFEDEDCATAQRLMEERDLLFLPVVDRQMRIVGIFSRAEIEKRMELGATSKPAGQPDT